MVTTKFSKGPPKCLESSAANILRTLSFSLYGTESRMCAIGRTNSNASKQWSGNYRTLCASKPKSAAETSMKCQYCPFINVGS